MMCLVLVSSHYSLPNMKTRLHSLVILAGFLASSLLSTGVVKAQIQDLDAFYTELSRTVAAGDYEGYAALYHEDAVLVSNYTNSTMPIANILAEWKQLFVDTKEGKIAAEVSFRFSQRYSDDKTAHETGIFRYVTTPKGGEPNVQLVHFEALVVNKGGWKWVMEYQKSTATLEEWEALK